MCCYPLRYPFLSINVLFLTPEEGGKIMVCAKHRNGDQIYSGCHLSFVTVAVVGLLAPERAGRAKLRTANEHALQCLPYEPARADTARANVQVERVYDEGHQCDYSSASQGIRGAHAVVVSPSIRNV